MSNIQPVDPSVAKLTGAHLHEPAYKLAYAAVHSGELLKMDKSISLIWRKRFCILLADCVFLYYDSLQDTEPLGSIDLMDVLSIEPSTKYKKFGFNIVCNRTYFFASETEQERASWIKAITTLRQDSKKRSQSFNVLEQMDSKFDLRRKNKRPEEEKTKRSRPFSVVVFSPQPEQNKENKDTQRFFDWAIFTMNFGSTVTKYPFLGDSSCKPKRRFIRLDDEHKKLCWGSTMNKLDRVLPVSLVEHVIYGPNSLTFTMNRELLKCRWRCLSLVCTSPSDCSRKRTVDLLFPSENDTLAWLVGLNYLLAGEKTTDESVQELQKVMSDHIWRKMQLQIEEKAHLSGKTIGAYVAEKVSKIMTEP